jgi:hypothetical protein
MSGGQSSVTIKRKEIKYKGYIIKILTEQLYPKKLNKFFYIISAYNEKKKTI